tara:strand:+ start:29 stop:400 length:372 start_codon:yes stop_codon:yes gene_type:complete
MTTFADMIDCEIKSHVEKPAKATIKSGGSVASTYKVKSSIADLQKEFNGLDVNMRQKLSGNISFTRNTRFPEALYKHLAEHISYIPNSYGGCRYVRKNKVAGFKQILTKVGVNLHLEIEEPKE